MSGLINGGGGGPPGFIKQGSLFTNFGTGNSSLKIGTKKYPGHFRLDPRIAQFTGGYLQGVEDLQGYKGSLSGFSPRYAQLSNEFAGNQGSLINARLNPLRRQVDTAQGQMIRDTSRRGLSGTTFGNQALANFATDTGLALGDAEALATADALEARASLLGQEMAAAQANVQMDAFLNQIYGEGAQNLLNQELQKIGVHSDIVAKMLGINNQAESIAASERANKLGITSQLAGGIIGGAGSLLTTSPAVTSQPSVFNNPYSQPSYGVSTPYGGFGQPYNWLTR